VVAAAVTDLHPLEGRSARLTLAAVRVMLALLWMQGAGWKNPSRFGTSSGFFYDFVADGVTNEVFAPWAWITSNLILPNWTVFAWSVFLVEVLLGAFLLIGLGTRLWALVGVAQSVAILLAVANTPNEWGWSYWLMIAGHLAVWATAAGRWYGLDGVLRPSWASSAGPFSRLMMRMS
jgi:thiosulfate dehydrogenase [quinone] large subunit